MFTSYSARLYRSRRAVRLKVWLGRPRPFPVAGFARRSNTLLRASKWISDPAGLLVAACAAFCLDQTCPWFVRIFIAPNIAAIFSTVTFLKIAKCRLRADSCKTQTLRGEPIVQLVAELAVQACLAINGQWTRRACSNGYCPLCFSLSQGASTQVVVDIN